MNTLKALVFDLDGTLLDTLDDLASAMNRVLAAEGLPTHDRERYRFFVGRGSRTLTERALGPEASRDGALVEKVHKAFQAVYAAHGEEQTRPYPEVDELLSALQERVLLFVLSNKDHTMTQHVVSRFLGQFIFDEVIGLRPGFAPKPDPQSLKDLLARYSLEPGEVAYLGDTDVDMQTARAAGVPAYGALWGFRSAEELQAAGASRLFASPLDFLDFCIEQLEA